MSLSEADTRLMIERIRQIYKDERNLEVRAKLDTNPGEVIIALLDRIIEDRTTISSTLNSTVEMAGFSVIESIKQRHAKCSTQEHVTS